MKPIKLPDKIRLVSAWTLFQNIGPKDDNGCMQWLGYCNPGGYGVASVNGRSYLATRFIYKMATGIDPYPLNMNHNCDNPGCCNPDHLWTGSQEEGNKDAVSKGRHAYGGSHGHRKLTEAEAIKIKSLKGQHSLRETARMFGVGQTCVWKIQNGKSWKHLP